MADGGVAPATDEIGCAGLITGAGGVCGVGMVGNCVADEASGTVGITAFGEVFAGTGTSI